MRKLMKRKVNLFGKEISVFVIALFAVALVSAALVGYLSNTIEGDVTVSSPMQINLDSITKGAISGDTFSVSLHGGESFALTTTTTNEADMAVANVLIEVKVPNFDGKGITYDHSDTTWSGNIPVCISGSDAYYYVGPAGGFTAPVNYNMAATSTITTDLALEPKIYTATVKVIKDSARVCGS